MKNLLVRISITLIVINAALAIAILLGGDMGDTGGRVLGTSLLATGTAMVSMVQLPALADRRIGILPAVAIGAGAVGFVMVTAAIWGDADNDLGWKVAGTAYTIAISGAIASILSGQRIEGRSAWVGTATLGAIGLAATMLVAAIWFDVGRDGYWRVFAVVAVLVAAGGLAVPILSRSSASPTPDLVVIACPFCASELAGQRASDAICPVCGSRFTVDLVSRAPGSGWTDDDE